MAFNANDIGELKAAIPSKFQPADMSAGALSRGFSAAGLSKLDQFNIGMGFLAQGEGAAPSFILPGSIASARHSDFERREKERRDEHNAVARMLSELNDRIAALDAQIAAINEDLRRIAARRVEIGEQLEAIEDIEELRRKGIKLDPANPAHAKLLRASGLSASEVNGDDYLTILLRKRAGLSAEDGTLALDEETKIKRRDDLTRERTDALGVRDELQGASTDEARILAERHASTVLGRDQLATAAYESNSAPVKVAAADAVAGAEREDRREASADLTRAATTSDKAAVLRTDTSNFAP